MKIYVAKAVTHPKFSWNKSLETEPWISDISLHIPKCTGLTFTKGTTSPRLSPLLK